MQEWMHKHRRLIMALILVFIGIPFVFMFGMPAMRGGPEAAQDNAIATVGGMPLKESEFRRSLDAAAASRAQQGAERPTYRELDQDGTAQRVLEQLIDATLVKLQEQQRNFYVDDALLVKQMQQWDMFKKDGRFDHAAWNEWVNSVARWDDIYDEMRGSVARQVFLSAIAAPSGRVLDRKIEEELKADNTKMRVKYAKIEPTITPTEEAVQQQFEENPDRYRMPEQHIAEFVAVSLRPETPDLAFELVDRARQGEDFATLAAEYSDLTEPPDGSLGWRAFDENVAPHLEPLFELAVGEVSDPIPAPAGFVIYKNEDERANEETGNFEVLGRQIVLNVALDDAERLAREQLADDIAAKLLEGTEPQTVAEEYGLEVLRTNLFDRMTMEIENVSDSDVFQFRTQVVANKETPWTPVKTRDNIFLAHIVESQEGALPPLDEVRERVVEGVINDWKQTEEYQERASGYAQTIAEQAKSLEDIRVIHPELEVEIGETDESFSRKDNLFQRQVYVQTASILDALESAEPGEIGGPVSGFFGDTWFFELVERIEPDEEMLAAMEDERAQVRERMVQMAEFELIGDYTKDLRERMLASVRYQQDTEAMDRILGRSWEEPEAPQAPETITGEELDRVVESATPISITNDTIDVSADAIANEETTPDAAPLADAIVTDAADAAQDEDVE